VRTIQLTVTLTGIVPADIDSVPAPEVKARAEEVAADTLRQVFRGFTGVTATATATVEGGTHD
jgi:hypothetical protein